MALKGFVAKTNKDLKCLVKSAARLTAYPDTPCIAASAWGKPDLESVCAEQIKWLICPEPRSPRSEAGNRNKVLSFMAQAPLRKARIIITKDPFSGKYSELNRITGLSKS